MKINWDWIKFISQEIVTSSIDNNFYTANGDLYEGDTTDIRNIMWEHYYVHIDFIKVFFLSVCF